MNFIKSKRQSLELAHITRLSQLALAGRDFTFYLAAAYITEALLTSIYRELWQIPSAELTRSQPPILHFARSQETSDTY